MYLSRSAAYIVQGIFLIRNGDNDVDRGIQQMINKQ